MGHKAAIVIPAEYCSNIREVMEEATDRAAAVIFGDLAVMCAYLPDFSYNDIDFDLALAEMRTSMQYIKINYGVSFFAMGLDANVEVSPHFENVTGGTLRKLCQETQSDWRCVSLYCLITSVCMLAIPSIILASRSCLCP